MVSESAGKVRTGCIRGSASTICAEVDSDTARKQQAADTHYAGHDCRKLKTQRESKLSHYSSSRQYPAPMWVRIGSRPSAARSLRRKCGNMYPNGVGKLVGFFPPDMLDQAGLADGFTGMYKQTFQQGGFLGGKRYGTAPGTYLPAGGIHCDCAAGQHTPFLYGAPAEQSPYPGRETRQNGTV